MIFYIMISMCHTLETRLKDSAREDADGMKKHPNIVAINFMNEVKITPIRKKFTSKLMHLIVLYMLKQNEMLAVDELNEK